ncbi:MAG: methionine--tRNA ligase [Candidatus Gracilibacteria bacterium]|nr:methionine--tRNA ligase [Candidatus Gracilibacteria bacterium]
MRNNFFVTTPIYYTNGIPHIGHAYSSLIADSIARYQKISGKKVKFSTGVDENSQKALDKANELGMEIMPYLDKMAAEHKNVWDGLKINYTDFIRTTEARHHKLVREVLQKSFDNGDIYEGEYEGLYCVGCESFKKDEDLVYMNLTTKETFPITDKVKPSSNIVKVCPDHLKEPQTLKEKNYFFRLSKYEQKLKDFYKENPSFVVPQDRFNEVIAFVDRGLEDFSISRETNKFGIKLPFDESQVTYVWYDALFNYVTVCKYSPHPNPLPKVEGIEQEFHNQMDFWPADLHVVGKDIIRFHAIYWPAMLLSAGYELPKNVLTTGYFTVDGQKISKSLGNAIDPVEFSGKYSKDLLTLYLLSSFNIGQDGDFDQKQAILTYNAKLANNFGNLLNRAVVLTMKMELENGLDSKVSDELLGVFKGLNFSVSSISGSIDYKGNTIIEKMDGSISSLIYHYYENFDKYMFNYNLKLALDLSFKFLDALNLYVTQKEPWTLMKDESKLEEVKEIMYTICEGVRQVSLNLYPFFPEKMTQVFDSLNLKDYKTRLEAGELKTLRAEKVVFDIKEKAPILFEKFELE